jgi:inorganic pyrophosphatase
VVPLAIVQARAIGGFRMPGTNMVRTSRSAVPVNDPSVSEYREVAQLPKHVMAEIVRFFDSLD